VLKAIIEADTSETTRELVVRCYYSNNIETFETSRQNKETE